MPGNALVCMVGVLLDRATDNQKEVAEMILEDPEGYSDEFAAVCLSQARMFEITEKTVRKHRRGKCACPHTEEAA